MRAYAAEILGEIIGDPRVIEALTRALFDNGSFSQGQIMAGSFEGFLVAAAKAKPVQFVREFALRSLIKIGDSAAAEALVSVLLDASFGSSIEKDSESLRPFGDVAIDLIIKGLSDENLRVRTRAAGFLCFLGNEDAVQAIARRLDMIHVYDEAKEVAVENLLCDPGTGSGLYDLVNTGAQPAVSPRARMDSQ